MVTYPNFFAISTGLYAESHEVLGNFVFNNRQKCIGYGDELCHYNRDVLPIWVSQKL